MTDHASVVSGTTRVCGIIGDPIEHSLSPVLHNTAYAEMNLDRVYVAFRVPAGGASAAVDAMRVLDLAGVSVTMPHKEAAAEACDVLTPAAEALRSVNTLTPLGDGRVEGSSTDGEGFLRALGDAGVDPSGRSVLLLGTGGAARAIGHALGLAGAEVVVAGRRDEAAERVAALAAGRSVPWEQRDQIAATVGLVVNATPIGMAGDSGFPVSAESLHRGQVVADLVYHPLTTPLLAAAEAAGAQGVDGLGMLLHQAALQIERWTGQIPPVASMRAAAKASLKRAG